MGVFCINNQTFSVGVLSIIVVIAAPVHAQEDAYTKTGPVGQVNSAGSASQELSDLKADISELHVDVINLVRRLEGLNPMSFSDLQRQTVKNQEQIALVKERVEPLRDHVKIFVSIISVGVAVFGLIVTTMVVLWQRGLGQVFREKVEKLGGEVNQRIQEICEFQNTLYRGFGVAALESLLGTQQVEALRLRDCFSASMLVLSTNDHNVRSGCLNLRSLRKRNVVHVAIARPALENALKNWGERQQEAKRRRERRETKKIAEVIKELQDTIKEVFQET